MTGRRRSGSPRSASRRPDIGAWKNPVLHPPCCACSRKKWHFFLPMASSIHRRITLATDKGDCSAFELQTVGAKTNVTAHVMYALNLSEPGHVRKVASSRSAIPISIEPSATLKIQMNPRFDALNKSITAPN